MFSFFFFKSKSKKSTDHTLFRNKIVLSDIFVGDNPEEDGKEQSCRAYAMVGNRRPRQSAAGSWRSMTRDATDAGQCPPVHCCTILHPLLGSDRTRSWTLSPGSWSPVLCSFVFVYDGASSLPRSIPLSFFLSFSSQQVWGVA